MMKTDRCIEPEDFHHLHQYKYIRMSDDSFRFVKAELNHTDAVEFEERSQIKSAGTFKYGVHAIIMIGYGSTTLGVGGALCGLDEIFLSDIMVRPVKADY